MKKVIEIWSTYPPPYGGVSIHSLRLYHRLKDKFEIVFKNFNGETNIPKEKIFKVSNPILMLLMYIFKRKRNIHLHSNRILVWFIMSFYPNSTNIVLTIHNHKLKKYLPFYERFIIRLFFKRIRFLILNDKQFADYLIDNFKINANKVIVIPAFIPPLPQETEPLPHEIDLFFDKFDKVISSFAWKLYKVNGKDVYGIEQIIEAFYKLNERSKIGLILIIPIIEDTEHYRNILDKIEKYNLKDNILLYEKPVRNGFDIWRKSDLFIRATTTDIEGISIKEALYFGVPVIATDVVERPYGIDTFKYGDNNSLADLIKNKLKEKNKKENINIEEGITDIQKIYNLL